MQRPDNRALRTVGGASPEYAQSSAMTTKQITLPITGMTCANCAATIERGLKKLPTVQNAAINLASERASLEFDPTQLTQQDIIARIQKSGYDVALGEA